MSRAKKVKTVPQTAQALFDHLRLGTPSGRVHLLLPPSQPTVSYQWDIDALDHLDSDRVGFRVFLTQIDWDNDLLIKKNSPVFKLPFEIVTTAGESLRGDLSTLAWVAAAVEDIGAYLNGQLMGLAVAHSESAAPIVNTPYRCSSIAYIQFIDDLNGLPVLKTTQWMIAPSITEQGFYLKSLYTVK